MVKIAVIGAGPMGLSSAVKIKEKYRYIDVVVIAKEFSPHTTADGSGGLWNPYLCGNNTDDLITKWGMETYSLYHKLWLEGGRDVCLMPVYCLNRKSKDPLDSAWTRLVFGFQHLGKRQLEYFDDLHSGEFVQGHTFTTFVVTPATMLQYLTTRFRNSGGTLMKAEVTSLSDAILDPYDVIVNCTGLRAREIVKDERVFPIRGQLVLVKAPWLLYTVMDDDGDNYIIPNVRITVLGGTHQENDYNTKIDGKDADSITNGCRKLIPGLKHANTVREWVGLRPARDEIRLEAEQVNEKLVIHNYGHGGSGMTLFWGCATDVLQLLDTKFYRTKKTVQNTVSKL